MTFEEALRRARVLVECTCLGPPAPLCKCANKVAHALLVERRAAFHEALSILDEHMQDGRVGIKTGVSIKESIRSRMETP